MHKYKVNIKCRKYLYDLELGKDFSIKFLKIQAIREKNEFDASIEIRFLFSKGHYGENK